MKHSTTIVLLRMLAAGLLLLLTSLPFGRSQGENIYYVKPNIPDTQCPGEVCLTISEYAEEVEQYSATNLTFVFLTGVHNLNKNFTITNTTTLALHGASATQTRVTCTAPVAFLFEDISSVSISGLLLMSCGSDINNHDYAAVTVRSVQWFNLSNCELKSNGNGTIFAKNSSMFFTNNTLAYNKGGIRAYESDLTFVGNVFESNSAEQGSVAYVEMCTLSLSGNTFENNTAAFEAGAIWTMKSKLTFSGRNSFIGNTASTNGGGIWASYSELTFSDNADFISNVAVSERGAVWASNSRLIFNGSHSFINNTVNNRGGGILASDDELIFTGRNNFMINRATVGGGMAVINCQVSFSEKTIFSDNHVTFGGGGIAAEGSRLTFSGDVLFTKNEARNNFAVGGCIYGLNSAFDFIGSSVFENNFASTGGGGIGVGLSNVTFHGESKFTDNIVESSGGGISSLASNLYFDGNFSFTNNMAPKGGALQLDGEGQMSFYPYTTIYFENNTARNKGGAISVQDSNPLAYCGSLVQFPFPYCFFQILEQNASDVDPSIALIFVNNNAQGGGDDLYGGAIDYCRLATPPYSNISSGRVFDGLVSMNTESPSISSDPRRVFFCKNGTNSHTVYPGGSFIVHLLALGQRDGPVSALIQSDFFKPVKARFSNATKIQQLDNSCTKLEYVVFLMQTAGEVPHNQIALLHTEGPRCSLSLSLQLEITILPCPSGFYLSDTSGECICEKRLRTYKVDCHIEDLTIERNDDFWVGFDTESNGLVLHPHCPFDYCIPETETVVFTLNRTDKQCNFNRSGHLCGACRSGQSLVLGSSHCHKCTNKTLALLIPFALAGFALVVLLLTCKLTVATGTINGLIFYANIVQVNRAIFFPQGDTNVLTVFIAWLNLDLGIETCFYDGMDVYSKTWLQFVFPVCIWALVGAIILFSHYFTAVARLLGTNPVSVLVTLFLLSYAKLIRTIITAFSFTFLEYPNNSSVVWLHDGNVSFLQGKHIPLFLAALLVLVFLFTPYTLLLLLGQWIQAHSEKRVFSWISDYRVKSFLDVYHAPYKPKHRYWTGLVLLVRSVLLLTFGLNAVGDSSVNLLAISACTLGLSMWVWAVGRMYKKWTLNILEASFILNLNILAVATFYVKTSGGNQTAVTYTSVSISFVTFIGILTFCTYLSLRDTKVWMDFIQPKLPNLYRRRQSLQKSTSSISTSSRETIYLSGALPRGVRAPTSSTVALRESLLDDYSQYCV